MRPPRGYRHRIAAPGWVHRYIGRFLRGLNASFNIALAQRRLEAIGALIVRFNFDHIDIQDALIDLAVAEAQDALRILSEVPNLDVTSQGALSDFIDLAPGLVDPGRTEIIDDNNRDSRLNHLRSLLSTALTSIGSNLTYQIGDGVLVF